jgi:rod shape-determining protein MreD
MRWIRFAVLVLLASVLQASLVGVMAILRPDIRPDLLLILLVFFATRAGSTDAVIASFVIGFIADLISPTAGVMGPRIISFGLFGTLLSEVQGVISTRRPLYQAVIIFLMGTLTAGLTYLLASLRAEEVPGRLAAQLLWQPLYSAVIGPLFFLPASWWMRMNKKRRRPYGRVPRSRR